MNKVKLSMIELFSGIGAQIKGTNDTGLFDTTVIATADIEKDAMVSYAAIHNGLTNESIDTYENYPSEEDMKKELIDKNIGIDLKKGTNPIARLKGKRLKRYWLAMKISNNLGDISKITRLPYADFWTYSFPCFTKDNYVLTDKGYKTIDKIEIGDRVLTHNNTYEKVLNTFNNGIRDTVKIKGQCIDEIVTTKNHKFYVREKYRRWNKERRSYDRIFKDPEWLEIDKVTKDYYLGVAINQKSIIPKWDGIDIEWSDGRKTRHKNELQSLMTNKNFWWLIGRYIADGWTRTQSGIVIAIGKHKLDEFIANIGNIFNYNIVEERTSYKCHIPLKELDKFVLQFGKGAINKKITNTIIDLPVDLLESFLEGYISGDGYYNKKDSRYKCSSISRELLIGLGQCVAKVYKTPFSLYKTNRPKKTKIEGRIVNQQDSYELTFKKDVRKQDNAFYEDGYIWYPFQSIEENGKEEVFDIEVENAHSFTVQNTIVHNCQDISVAGKQAGIVKGGTRSGLLYEVERLLEIAKVANTLPKYLMLENVKNLVGKQFKPQFDEWINRLDELGFNTYWQVINGKNCGIAQNRERIFAISIRKDIDTGLYEFPKPFDLGYRLRDFLEDIVDEKYYLSQEIQDRLQITDETFTKNIIGTTKPDFRTIGQRDLVYQKDSIMGALVATDYKQPKQILEDSNELKQVMTLSGGKWDKINESCRRIYSEDGIAPTLHTCGGGNTEAKVVFEERRDEGIRLFKGDYVGTLRTIDSCGDKRVAEYINGKRAVKKLTPKECWRLMGFADNDYEKALSVGLSDSAGYKQAGNSIVTTCIELIMEHLYKAQYDNTYICSDERILNGELEDINFIHPQVV